MDTLPRGGMTVILRKRPFPGAEEEDIMRWGGHAARDTPALGVNRPSPRILPPESQTRQHHRGKRSMSYWDGSTWMERGKGGGDPYRVLGVQKGASATEIKTAYINLAKMCHPDACNGRKGAHEEFLELAGESSVWCTLPSVELPLSGA